MTRARSHAVAAAAAPSHPAGAGTPDASKLGHASTDDGAESGVALGAGARGVLRRVLMKPEIPAARMNRIPVPTATERGILNGDPDAAIAGSSRGSRSLGRDDSTAAVVRNPSGVEC